MTPSIHTVRRLADALGADEAILLVSDSPVERVFLRYVHERGVQIRSTEDARRAADAVARALATNGHRSVRSAH